MKAQNIPDDLGLLQTMMKDMNQADDLYKPTVYWKVYERMFLPELMKHGLTDFRRRRNSILASFSSVDLLIKGTIEPAFKFKGSGTVKRFLEKIAWDNPIFPFSSLTSGRSEWVTPYFFQQVQNKFKRVGLDLTDCPTTLLGNPEDISNINNTVWSLSHLNFCSMIADAAEHIKFHDRMIACELGAGMGRNIEILARLFPSTTLIIFDIPPQLYVANQYLNAVFGKRVIPYREAISLKPENNDEFYRQVSGKIILLPAWSMPQWKDFNIDLFWNCASFQEMEPPVVKNYLSLVKTMRPKDVYINALPGGNFQEGNAKGGTREPVLSRYYSDFLGEQYHLKTEYKTDNFLCMRGYTSYIFKSKANT